jgi:hypothetical protein
MVVPVLMMCCQVLLKPKPSRQAVRLMPLLEAAHVDGVFRVESYWKDGATNGRLNVPFGLGVAEGKCSLANSMCSPAIPRRNSRLR